MEIFAGLVRFVVFNTDSRERKEKERGEGEGRSGSLLGWSWACSGGLARAGLLGWLAGCGRFLFFFDNKTLSLHDALPISSSLVAQQLGFRGGEDAEMVENK